MPRYERQLRQWRRRLQEHRGNTEAVKEVREELIAFRRARRGEGWELRLGSLDVQVRGFRGDTAMAEGFRRIVLKLGESGRIYYLVGEANHIQLDEDLSIKMRQGGVLRRTSIPLSVVPSNGGNPGVCWCGFRAKGKSAVIDGLR